MKTKPKQFEQFNEISSVDLCTIHGGMDGTIWEILKMIVYEHFSKDPLPILT